MGILSAPVFLWSLPANQVPRFWAWPGPGDGLQAIGPRRRAPGNGPQATGSRQSAPGNGPRGERPLVSEAIGGLAAVLGSRCSRIAQAGFGHCDQLAAD